jgi:hypothetical protein
MQMKQSTALNCISASPYFRCIENIQWNFITYSYTCKTIARYMFLNPSWTVFHCHLSCLKPLVFHKRNNWTQITRPHFLNICGIHKLIFGCMLGWRWLDIPGVFPLSSVCCLPACFTRICRISEYPTNIYWLSSTLNNIENTSLHIYK